MAVGLGGDVDAIAEAAGDAVEGHGRGVGRPPGGLVFEVPEPHHPLRLRRVAAVGSGTPPGSVGGGVDGAYGGRRRRGWAAREGGRRSGRWWSGVTK